MAVLRVLRPMNLIWRMSLKVLGGCFVVVQQMVTDAYICIPAGMSNFHATSESRRCHHRRCMFQVSQLGLRWSALRRYCPSD